MERKFCENCGKIARPTSRATDREDRIFCGEICMKKFHKNQKNYSDTKLGDYVDDG